MSREVLAAVVAFALVFAALLVLGLVTGHSDRCRACGGRTSDTCCRECGYCER